MKTRSSPVMMALFLTVLLSCLPGASEARQPAGPAASVVPVPAIRAEPRPREGIESRSYSVVLPEEWKGKLAVGKVSIIGPPFYGVAWQLGTFSCLRLQYSLTNLTPAPLYVLVNYRTESKARGRGNSGAGACYKLAPGEGRLVDVISPIAAFDRPLRYVLRMLPLDRPPRLEDQQRDLLVIDPLPLGTPEAPTGKAPRNQCSGDHFRLENVQLETSNQVNTLTAKVVNQTDRPRALGLMVGVNDCQARDSRRGAKNHGFFRRVYGTVAARSTGEIAMPYELPTTGPRPILTFQVFEPLQGIPDPMAPDRDFAVGVAERDCELISWGAVDLVEAAKAGDCLLIPPPPVEERARLTAETKSAHFVFRYRPGSTAERNIGYIVREREAIYTRLSTLFRMELPGPVQIDLYPDIEAKGLGSGTVGNVANTVNASHTAEVYNENTRIDHGHEIAHLFSFRFPGHQDRGGEAGKPADGFVEGFACCFQSAGSAEGALASLRARAGARPMPPIPEIIASPGPGAGSAQVALVDFLVKKDAEKFKSFYVRVIASPDANTIAQAASDLYGAPLAKLEQEWQGYLQVPGRTGIKAE